MPTPKRQPIVLCITSSSSANPLIKTYWDISIETDKQKLQETIIHLLVVLKATHDNNPIGTKTRMFVNCQF